MSFSISAAGTVDQVRAQVEAAECSGDTTQFDRAKMLILSEVDDLAQANREGYTPGLYVNASGHHDSHTRNLNLTLQPLWLPVTEPQ